MPTALLDTTRLPRSDHALDQEGHLARGALEDLHGGYVTNRQRAAHARARGEAPGAAREGPSAAREGQMIELF
ncbi:MAG: hypothetical protein M0004_11360 [Actinomycetota bacterium]|nr:hypothetical protein [Actinomycetota bacterium]